MPVVEARMGWPVGVVDVCFVEVGEEGAGGDGEVGEGEECTAGG